MAGSSTAARRSRRSATDVRRAPGGPRPATSVGLGDALHGQRDRGDLGADLSLEAVPDVAVLAHELLRRLASVTQACLAVVEPRPGLADDVEGHADVQEAAVAGHAFAVHDVELGDAERRGDLVLDDLDADPAADGLRAVLDGLDAADVQAHRGVELEGAAAGRDLRVAEHHADLLAQLVGEDEGGVRP